jgi:glutaconate CoA-transferase subunit B
MAIEENYSPLEIMTYRVAQELKNETLVFVGVGLPILAASLARATHAPDLMTVVESGVFGSAPTRLPLSVADPAIVQGALLVTSTADIFQNYLQGGLIDFGILSGGQIDRYGNINSTVIGDYKNPQERLPGSGGACEIALLSKKLIIVMPMTSRSFVESCDFITTPGHFYNSKKFPKGENLVSNPSPYLVVTNLGVCGFENGEMVLSEIYPEVSVEDVKSNCAWPLKISENLSKIQGPSKEVLILLREKLDPHKLYL